MTEDFMCIERIVISLESILNDADDLATRARVAVHNRNQNLAMGILLPMVDKLEIAQHLLKAAIALHRGGSS